MTVSIVSSPVIGSSQYPDVLSGGDDGCQYGTIEATQTPTKKEIWVRHDGASKITNLAVFIKAYSGTYGGEYSASADLVKTLDQGEVGYGFQIDWNWNGVDFASYICLTPAQGGSQETAIEIPATSILKNVGGIATAVSSAVQGELHPAGSPGAANGGDTALLKTRWVCPTDELAPGRRQIDLAYIYNFTT